MLEIAGGIILAVISMAVLIVGVSLAYGFCVAASEELGRFWDRLTMSAKEYKRHYDPKCQPYYDADDHSWHGADGTRWD